MGARLASRLEEHADIFIFLNSLISRDISAFSSLEYDYGAILSAGVILTLLSLKCPSPSLPLKEVIIDIFGTMLFAVRRMLLASASPSEKCLPQATGKLSQARLISYNKQCNSLLGIPPKRAHHRLAQTRRRLSCNFSSAYLMGCYGLSYLMFIFSRQRRQLRSILL